MVMARGTGAILALLTLAGCQALSLDSGRYMRMRDVLSGDVSAQLSWPSPEVCVAILQSWSTGDERQRASARASSCTRTSLGAELPFRATVRDSESGALLDFETRTLARCTAFLEAAAKSVDALQLVVPCSPKEAQSNAAAVVEGERRAIALQWEGDHRPTAGVVTISQRGLSGKISAKLPEGAGECVGMYEARRDGTGQWALSCTNGLTVIGSFRALGPGKGSVGSGTATTQQLALCQGADIQPQALLCLQVPAGPARVPTKATTTHVLSLHRIRKHQRSRAVFEGQGGPMPTCSLLSPILFRYAIRAWADDGG